MAATTFPEKSFFARKSGRVGYTRQGGEQAEVSAGTATQGHDRHVRVASGRRAFVSLLQMSIPAASVVYGEQGIG